MDFIRKTLSGNRGLAIAATSVLLLATIGLAWNSAGPARETPPTARQFFYDEKTGEESVRDSADLAPLANANGEECIVQAVYMTNDGGKTKTLMYLMKYTPEAKALMKKIQANSRLRLSSDEYTTLTKGTLYRLPAKDSPWLPEDEAAAIVSRRLPASQGIASIVKP